MISLERLESSWVANRGGSCTTAAVLAVLGALGATELPELGAATLALGARQAYGPPPLRDYVGWPGRPARLDQRIEALALRCRLSVCSRTRMAVPGRRLRGRPGEPLIANLAWGQERPGRYGTWGFHPLRPATYAVGGHSVVVAGLDGEGWLVLDPNHRGLQVWPRRGLAVTATRIRRAP